MFFIISFRALGYEKQAQVSPVRENSWHIHKSVARKSKFYYNYLEEKHSVFVILDCFSVLTTLSIHFWVTQGMIFWYLIERSISYEDN